MLLTSEASNTLRLRAGASSQIFLEGKPVILDTLLETPTTALSDLEPFVKDETNSKYQRIALRSIFGKRSVIPT